MGILFFNEVEYLKKECIYIYIYIFCFVEDISESIVEEKVMRYIDPDLEVEEDFSIYGDR